jgi:hypothetical protein
VQEALAFAPMRILAYCLMGTLSPWPVPEPPDYRKWLNHSQAKEEIENIRYAIQRSRPYGSEKWVAKAVARFGLESPLRNPWRPAKGLA